MKVAGELTETDLKEVRKIMRSKWYWAKFILANWYGLALMLAVLWATVAGVTGTTKPNWRAIGIIWAVIAVVIAWSIYRTKTATERELSRLNSTLPDSIALTSDGLWFEGPNGASEFQPWRNFSRWREGQRVAILYRSEGTGFVILPVADLPGGELQSLRDLLQSALSLHDYVNTKCVG